MTFPENQPTDGVPLEDIDFDAANDALKGLGEGEEIGTVF
jgi:hypothetical protein